jgi:hypothetical protein
MLCCGDVLQVRLYEDEQGSPIVRPAYKRKGSHDAEQTAAAAKSPPAPPCEDQPFETWQQQQHATPNADATSTSSSGGSGSQLLAAVSAAACTTWQAALHAASFLPFMGWCCRMTQPGSASLARSGYVPHSRSPCRSGSVGGCSSGGTPLSVDESLLHDFTLFGGQKKPREKYTYVDELGDRPYRWAASA